MSDDHMHRIGEGNDLFRDQITKITQTAEAVVPAVKGFRRDLGLALQASPDHIRADFPPLTAGLIVPVLEEGRSFSDLYEMLRLVEEGLDGAIRLRNPASGPDQKEKEIVLDEVGIIHQNLMDISETSRRLYESLKTAQFEFDVFNTKNIEAKYPEANILFDRDSLNLSMATARALGERAVRMDIDLMDSRKRLETGQSQKI